jgi:cathepsin A (carboxypeptidase C)
MFNNALFAKYSKHHKLFRYNQTMGSRIFNFQRLIISAIVGFLLLLSTISATTYQDDEIVNLPGLTFNLTFKQYSGFLPTSTKSNLHYWLVEAQQNAASAPLLLWLNGGPGCSSLSGLFQENGPFQVNPDGATLIENIYSWNKIANVMYLEAPRDVGFSYGTPANVTHNDNWTRDDNAEALQQFVMRFPQYAGRDFYISGESYGGVYVPTLSQKVIELTTAGTLNLKFKGMAVGNGILSNFRQVDSYVDLSFYRGVIGKSQIEFLKSCCPYTNLEPAQVCNYTATYLQFDVTNGLYSPKPSTDPTFIKCANAVANIGQLNMWESELYADVYNSIQSCYTGSEGYQNGLLKDYFKVEKLRSTLAKFSDSPVITDGLMHFIDQGSQINTKSSDPFAGYRCYSNDAMISYLNRNDVKQAIHIPSAAMGIKWIDCADEGYFAYTRQYPEMDGVFQYLLNWSNGLKILVYNGDTDSVCNYLGDQWFVEDLKLPLVGPRRNWHFTLNPGFTNSEVAGSHQRFSMSNNSAYIDLVTVKGSGHMVPTDRPGQALQMITNFIYGSRAMVNYDTPANVSMDRKPLFPQYTTNYQMITRKDADRVYNLPGLTFPINFDNYAGYLKGVPGNYLHYWLLTSQTSPSSDPLFLWLTGGPGCSGLGALLTELGPFRPNPDNRTLSENVFTWNKFANVLFLESPRGVGFSFQDPTINNDTVWDDDRSANDAYLALKDFFGVYPEFQNRPFYIIGESYGGVYVPMLTSLLVQKIQSGDIKNVNLVGMAVGNGELNSIIGANSLLSDMYFHGYLGTGEWARLKQCCNTTYQLLPLCPFDERYVVAPDGEAYPVDPNDECDILIADKINNVWTEDMLYYSDVYNQNQDCYQQTSYLLGSVRSAKTRQKVVKHTKKLIQKQKDAIVTNYVDAYRYNNDNYNPISTDQLGGFPCFGTDAAADYLNKPEVRRALHVPENNPNINQWAFCNDDVNMNYIRQYNDTGIFFDRIFQSNYPIKILIYNGDTDYACNFMGDQWFTEKLAAKWSFTTTKPYKEWHYRNEIAGYAKQFAAQNVKLNLVTVKGAGHMVPMDRPGPAMQLMSNFFNDRDFSTPIIYSSENTPLKQQYRIQEMLTNITLTQKTSASRKAKAILNQNNQEIPRVKREAKPDPQRPPPGSKEADRVTALPGVTFQQTNHYSGYLEAHTGVFLHYWLIETPFNQTTAPIILWLNGGPGCSSLGGLINELGPIRPSKDGNNLVENPFAWTKAGNVFFLESPRGVGFSYSSGAEVPSDAPYNDTYV